MRSLILSQCRDLRIGVTREDLGALTRNYVADIYQQEKLRANPPRGFCPQICKIYTQNLRMYTLLFKVLPSPYRQAR